MARFYDIDAANAVLDELRPLLEALRADRDEVAEAQAGIAAARAADGGGTRSDEIDGLEDRLRTAVRRMRVAVETLDGWGITLRDIDTGLVDFPALASGRQIWLCWRLGEPRVDWWHELESGFGSRRPLSDLS